ncbi:MAG: hypothetical protein ACXACA_05340 [Candidatus Ranarchaeia archaeon]|jgi:hypothetical protein
MEIDPAIPLEVQKMSDLLRFLMAGSTRQHIINVYYFKYKGDQVFGALTSAFGYYDLRGLPIFIFVRHPDPPAENFIQYRTEPEQWKFVADTSDLKFQYIPIVKLAEAPPFFALKK